MGISPVAQRVKHLPAVQEMQVRSLGREDPLEKEMATHSGTLVWKLPWMEKPGRLTVHGVPKSGTQLSDFTFTFSLSFLGASRMPHPLQQGAPSISSVFPRHIWSQLCLFQSPSFPDIFCSLPVDLGSSPKFTCLAGSLVPR